MNENKNRNPMSIAALVLGISSIALSFFGYSSILATASGIVGIIFAVKAKKENPNSMATAGLVTSIIGLCISGIVLIACVACAGTLACIGLGATTI